VQKVSLGYSGL